MSSVHERLREELQGMRKEGYRVFIAKREESCYGAISDGKYIIYPGRLGL